MSNGISRDDLLKAAALIVAATGQTGVSGSFQVRAAKIYRQALTEEFWEVAAPSSAPSPKPQVKLSELMAGRRKPRLSRPVKG